jgi:hypothetical protein
MIGSLMPGNKTSMLSHIIMIRARNYFERRLRGTKLASLHFPCEAVTRRSTRRLSRIAKGLNGPAVQNARARIAKGGGLIEFQSSFESRPS